MCCCFINKQNCIKVLSSDGDNRFGGDQFNKPLIKLFYDNFINDGGNDFLKKNLKKNLISYLVKKKFDIYERNRI